MLYLSKVFLREHIPNSALRHGCVAIVLTISLLIGVLVAFAAAEFVNGIMAAVCVWLAFAIIWRLAIQPRPVNKKSSADADHRPGGDK